MLMPTPSPTTLWQFRNRGDALRDAVDAVLTAVAKGSVHEVADLEARLAKVHRRHSWTSYQEIVDSLPFRLRALWSGPDDTHSPALIERIAPEVRSFLKVDQLLVSV